MNTEKQLQLATFEQAKKLKELGFDWKVPKYYEYEAGETEQDVVLNKGYGDYNCIILPMKLCCTLFSAPTVALALKWFRDVKNVVTCIAHEHAYYGHFDLESKYYLNTKFCMTYEAAESALLDELLNYFRKTK